MASAISSVFDRPGTEELGGFLILTRSAHEHLMLTWAHPQPPPGLLATLQCRARFNEPYFGRFNGLWHYCFPRRAAGSPEATITCVYGRVFSPEMLLTLAKCLSDAFAASGGSTLAAQAAWMSAYCDGGLGEGGATWSPAKFDASKNFRATGAKVLLQGLGVEAILVWTALMLRKRVAVLGSSAAEVIRAVRILPLLVAHRFDAASTAAGTGGTLASPAGLMHPYVALGDAALLGGEAGEANMVDLTGPLGAATRAALEEGTAAQLADLAECGSWVAGFTDSGVATRGGDLWDVCVDLRTKTVVVAEAAKGAVARAGAARCARPSRPSFIYSAPPHPSPLAGELALGSVHKEIAKALVEALESSDTSDNAVLAAVASKTATLVQRLCAMLPEGLPVGVPAGALPTSFTSALPMEGIVGESASAALKAGFRDTLVRSGMAAAVGASAGEGFLWGVCGAEPQLQRLASVAIQKALASAAAAAAAAAAQTA